MTHSPLTRSGVLTDILGRTGSVTAIARKHGVPKTYVRELARSEAIDLPDGRDPRGGFRNVVPDELKAEYRFFTRRKRLPASEAGEALGLIPRKVA